MTGRGPSPIVVGLDGSEGGAAALEWAVAEAAVRGCLLQAVSVSGVLDRMSEPGDGPPPKVEQASRQLTQAGVRYPSVAMRHVRLFGSPAPELVRIASGAAMLVVGSHGVTRAVRPLLGSVSSYCAKNAGCPVVIVPDAKRTLATVAPLTAGDDHTSTL